MLSTLEERDRKEMEAIEREYHSNDYASTSLPGRQTGDKKWRISRSEFGSGDNCSLSSSSCPVRMCIDEHVTRIYNSLFATLHSFISNSISKSRAIEILKMFKRIVVELKDSPFQTRKTSIKPDSDSEKCFIDQMLPSFGDLLEALSLKSDLRTDGLVQICLAGDPIRTSLALPVVLNALDDVIHHLKNCDNFGKDALSLPLVKLNRICSGLVLASAEELPFGIVSKILAGVFFHCFSLLIHNLCLKCLFIDLILKVFFSIFQATSAFDGNQNSKWEEPNGASGTVTKIEHEKFDI